MSVTLSLRSLADIQAIGDHIAEDSRSAANRFSQKLLDACVDVGLFPERYPIVDESAGWPVRRRPYRTYSIFYIARDAEVLILRVTHSGQDYPRLFDD